MKIKPQKRDDTDQSHPLRLFDVAEFSVHDGPGIRVVIYFQGCEVQCDWCHSPHSQPLCAPLLFNCNACTGCRRCVSVCSNRVHLFREGKHLINRKKCVQCGVCIEQCPNSITAVNGSALYLPTVTTTVSSLLRQIEPYLRLIGKNGGITLSGGEALLQLNAVKELLQYCKQKKYHIALETSGLLSTEIYEQVIPLVDLWLFGMRVITGKKEARHDDHIKGVLDMLVKQNADILPRIPMVPGFFNRDDVLQSLATLLQTHALNTICLNPWNRNYSVYYNQSDLPMQMPMPACEEVENCENKIITFFNNLNFVQYENKKIKAGNEH